MSTEVASVFNVYESICRELVDELEFYELIKEGRKFYSSSKIYTLSYEHVYNCKNVNYDSFGSDDEYDSNSDSDDYNYTVNDRLFYKDVDNEIIHKYQGELNDVKKKDDTKYYTKIINSKYLDDLPDECEEGTYLKRDIYYNGETYLSDFDGNIFTDDLTPWGINKGEGIMLIAETQSGKIFKDINYDGYISMMKVYKKYCNWVKHRDIILTSYTDKNTPNNLFKCLPIDVTRKICEYN